VPCYKRPEYTAKCIKALEIAQRYRNVLFVLWDDGSNDGTTKILEEAKLEKKLVCSSKTNEGLRNILINFIVDPCRVEGYGIDIMGVMGNDCAVPKNWLNDILDIFQKTDVQILSPNVFPSGAAYKYGQADSGLGYMPSKIVGGLWFMYTLLAMNTNFERHNVKGITGAFNILKQIVIEKDPKIGWAPDIVVQDMGHWSGAHPEHIKDKEHFKYYQEVGRKVSW